MNPVEIFWCKLDKNHNFDLLWHYSGLQGKSEQFNSCDWPCKTFWENSQKTSKKCNFYLFLIIKIKQNKKIEIWAKLLCPFKPSIGNIRWKQREPIRFEKNIMDGWQTTDRQMDRWLGIWYAPLTTSTPVELKTDNEWNTTIDNWWLALPQKKYLLAVLYFNSFQPKI